MDNVCAFKCECLRFADIVTLLNYSFPIHSNMLNSHITHNLLNLARVIVVVIRSFVFCCFVVVCRWLDDVFLLFKHKQVLSLVSKQPKQKTADKQQRLYIHKWIRCEELNNNNKYYIKINTENQHTCMRNVNNGKVFFRYCPFPPFPNVIFFLCLLLLLFLSDVMRQSVLNAGKNVERPKDRCSSLAKAISKCRMVRICISNAYTVCLCHIYKYIHSTNFLVIRCYHFALFCVSLCLSVCVCVCHCLYLQNILFSFALWKTKWGRKSDGWTSLCQKFRSWILYNLLKHKLRYTYI